MEATYAKRHNVSINHSMTSSMKFTKEIKEAVLDADSKALGTNGPHGLNVVPVSSIRVENGQIWLVNYFMKKTLENILEDPQVALTCWKGMKGFQIKGKVEYQESGDIFAEVKDWVAETLPDRVVKGVLVIDPEETYSITP